MNWHIPEYHEPDSWDALPRLEDPREVVWRNFPRPVKIALVLACGVALAYMVWYLLFSTSVGFMSFIEEMLFFSAGTLLGVSAGVAGLVVMIVALRERVMGDAIILRILGLFGISLLAWLSGWLLPQYFLDLEAGPLEATVTLDSVELRRDSVRRYLDTDVFHFITTTGEHIPITIRTADKSIIEKLEESHEELIIRYYPRSEMLLDAAPATRPSDSLLDQ